MPQTIFGDLGGRFNSSFALGWTMQVLGFLAAWRDASGQARLHHRRATLVLAFSAGKLVNMAMKGILGRRG